MTMDDRSVPLASHGRSPWPARIVGGAILFIVITAFVLSKLPSTTPATVPPATPTASLVHGTPVR